MVSASLRLYLAICFLALNVAATTLTVTKVGVIGTGCVPGTAEAEVDNNLRKIRVRVSNFKAEAGPGISIAAGRKNCAVTLNVQIPEGYSVSLDKAVVKAAYSVDSGVSISSTSRSHFQGQLEEGSGSSSVSGPGNGDATLVNDLSPANWSPCGGDGIVVISTDLRVSNSANRKGSGSIAVKGSWESDLVWKKC
ncbi:hypothetical protein FA15DRAFT_646134 [Coprinopsis marcescibilis]|uniref:Secreted protein n=1 Tax=Coprinopsis marcescibilis TaxID=230819 RepID=A0A5C3KLA9_COPMA|nr:hypothetical protein FA15DRAFT_646134 [Coprinopsis marcescibilis]